MKTLLYTVTNSKGRLCTDLPYEQANEIYQKAERPVTMVLTNECYD